MKPIPEDVLSFLGLHQSYNVIADNVVVSGDFEHLNNLFPGCTLGAYFNDSEEIVFAIIGFETKEEAQKAAKEMTGYEFDGEVLRVVYQGFREASH